MGRKIPCSMVGAYWRDGDSVAALSRLPRHLSYGMVAMRRRVHTHYVPEPVGERTLFDPPPEPWEVYALPLQHGPDGKLVRNLQPPAQPVDTSLEAARKITQHTARIREAIWLYLRTQGAWGATAGELEVALGLSGSTVRPRLLELEGRASWAKGKLPARIQRTSEKRDGMRVYQVVTDVVPL